MNAEETAEKLTAWIKEIVTSTGHSGTVLGLSGGIDSSVLGVLCRRAFPESTLGLIMPCHSIDEDRIHAETMAKQFSIRTVLVPLDGIYDTFLKVLPELQADDSRRRMAGANLKARLRMSTLYYTANQLRYLVAGSGNRSELTVGYFTKFGDSGVDILPLGNLVKAEIRELAGYLGIPREIVVKPPSAGLWEGQTDEGEMGFTYADLDRYILTGKAPPEIKRRIDAMKSASRHKLALPPIARFD
ncbi:MAG: NAD(+) synthase [Chloroflexi bacterium RBG_16_56_11]|nr:MAG: NAD(+) synthase [Chloroflexi bacterium RBG_16_56_11]